MKTRRPFSSIWYGSSKFLKDNLDKLVRKGDLLFYAFVNHIAEEDEKKDHIHVYMEPDGTLDTKQLIDLIQEIDLSDKDLRPVKLLPCDSSKFSDWYLYTTHNITYLASKGQKRKYHYKQEDFISSNSDFFNEKVHRIDMSKLNSMEFVRNAALQGIPFEAIVMDGQVPIQQIYQYQKAYEMIVKLQNTVAAETYRNMRQKHEIENSSNIRFVNGDRQFLEHHGHRKEEND